MLSLIIFLSIVSKADPALQQTQDVLRNKEQRNKVIQQLPDNAKKADKTIDAISGGDDAVKEQMYDVSADIMKNFEGMSPEQMQELLSNASKNPEGFYKSLSPEQRSKIKQISDQLERKQKKP